MPLRSYGQAFLSRPAARSQRLVAFTVGVLMLLTAAGLSPMAHVASLHRPLFEPIWLVCLLLSQGFTALMLALQASHLRHPTLALLAGAYTFMTLTTGFQLMVYPGVLTLEGWPELSTVVAPWISILARFCFPLWALLAVWRMDRAVPRWLLWTAWLVPSLLAATIIFTVLHSVNLPPLIVHFRYSTLLNRTLLPMGLGLNVLTVILMAYQTRLRTRLHLWLCVVLIAQFSALLLAWLSEAQHTVGWYGAHVLTALSSLILLAALLWDIHDIHRNLQHINARLHEDATHDGLTGLLTRKVFMEQMHQALKAYQQRAIPCALIMLDVDHFKLYNDAFGHLAGDACLTTVASALRTHTPTRESDVARYGGEEFAVLLHGKAAEQAQQVAEGLRLSVWREQLQHSPQAPTTWVSISVGVAQAHADSDVRSLIQRADQALYAAKADGRNTVSISA